MLSQLLISLSTYAFVIVLRTDGVHRLVLNTYLFKGMGFSYGQDNRYVKFGVFGEAKPSFYTLRVIIPLSFFVHY